MMNALLQYRIDRGMTRSALAGVLSVDPVTVWRWEKGKMQIPVERLADIERLTGISRRALRPDVFGDVA